MRFSASLLFFIVFLLSTLSEGNAKTFSSETFTLNNGLKVVIVPNHKVPAVTHMICYRAGSIDDPQGKSGIAHFLEHLMFKGTAKFPKGAFSSLVAHNGGNDNAYTSHDYTAYYQTIAVDKLPLVMEMEADRMRGTILNPQEVLRERDVILEERSARIDNNPKSLLLEQMSAALFPNHPYHRPVIGWRHEMKGLTLADAKNFYDRYYTPHNAIVIVAGDITAEELRPLAEKYYGALKNTPLPARISFPAPPTPTSKRVELADKNVTVPELVRFYMAPSATPSDYKEGATLSVLAHILGGGDTSRLYQSMVTDKAIAASLQTAYDPINIGPSVFSITIIPRQGQTLASLEQVLDAELVSFLDKGISKEELSRTKTLLRAEGIYAKESFKTLAFLFAHVLSSGLPATYLEKWEEMIDDVTIADVNNAALRLLETPHRVTGTLLPAPAAGK
jgi:zinc protease